jgi:hypothetical protein
MITPEDFQPEVAATPEEFMFEPARPDPDRPAPTPDEVLAKSGADPKRRVSADHVLAKAQGRVR